MPYLRKLLPQQLSFLKAKEISVLTEKVNRSILFSHYRLKQPTESIAFLEHIAVKGISTKEMANPTFEYICKFH